jgi:tRNA G18 (ribose-2'-O)-methylase SpoU
MVAKDLSLNAADAATVLLYEVLRQRRAPPR